MANTQGQKIGRIGILSWLMKLATYFTIVIISMSATRYFSEQGASTVENLVSPVTAVLVFGLGLFMGNKVGRITGVFFAAMFCLWAVGIKTATLWILEQGPSRLMQSTPIFIGLLIVAAIAIIDFVLSRIPPK